MYADLEINKIEIYIIHDIKIKKEVPNNNNHNIRLLENLLYNKKKKTIFTIFAKNMQ